MTPISAAAMADDKLNDLKERKRLLDDVWLLALFVLFFTVGVPWYLRILDIDFNPVAWSLFGFGAVYIVTSLLADRLRSHASLLFVIGTLQAAGVLFIGFVWHLTGSLQNPLLLLMFVLPVVAGSLVLVNWQAYATVLLSVATVLVVALMDAPELRWYAARVGSTAKWMMDLLPQFPGTRPLPYPSLNAPPSYLSVLLVIFTVFLLTISLMTEALTTFLRRLYGRLEAAASALSVAEALSSEVLRASSLPAALIQSDTLKIEQASQSFLDQLFLTPESLLNKDLLGLVEFSYPEVITDLIRASGGEVPLVAYRVDGEARMAKVQIHSLEYNRRRYAYLTLQDISEFQYMHVALNAAGDALIVISVKQLILYFNNAAKDLFQEMSVGIHAKTPLGHASLPEGWWELGMRNRQERSLELKGKRLVATCMAVRILGERDALTVLCIRNLGEGIMRKAIYWLLLLGCAAAHAQSSAPDAAEVSASSQPAAVTTDHLILTGGMDRLSSWNDGGNGSLDWVRAAGKGRTYTAGFAAFSLMDSRWAFGRGGISFGLGDNIIVQGQASVGGGHSEETKFGYQVYGAGITYKLIQSLYFSFSQEHLQVGETRGELLKPGVTLVPRRGITTDLFYTHSAGGNFGTEFVSGRVEAQKQFVRVLGGFAAGHAIPEIINVVGIATSQPPSPPMTQPPSQSDAIREGYLGLGVPLYRTELTLIFDHSQVSSTHKNTLTLSLKLPLGDQGPERR